MRTKIFRFAATVIALLAIGLPRAAVAEAELDATTQSNLNFGQIIATATAGTVTVSPSSERSRFGGVVLGNALRVSAASFLVTGEPNTEFSITLPSSCTLSAGGSSMIADGFTSSPDDSGNLGPSGTQSVTLGATLHVGAGQASAEYSGICSVTLSYN